MREKKVAFGTPTQAGGDLVQMEKVTVSGSTQNGDMVRVEMDKDDHGNEESKPISPKEYVERLEYVDHTAKGSSKVKIFYNEVPGFLEEEYNKFLQEHNGKIKVQGGQFQIRTGGFAIALYYEETK